MIGLKACSDGTTGLHYVGVCSIVMLVIAVAMFSMTTKNATKTCRYILIGYIIFEIVFKIISSIGMVF